MAQYATGTTLEQLNLVGEPADASAPAPANADKPAEASAPAPANAPPPKSGAPVARGDSARIPDEYLAEATREFESGHLDRMLWVRSMTQVGGDAVQAKAAYLRVRATAFRVEKRDLRAQRPDRRDRVAKDARGKPASAAWAAAGKLDRKRVAIAAGVLAMLAAVVGFLFLRPGSPPSAASPAISQPNRPAPAKPEVSAAKAAPNASGAAMSGEDFARKVQEFKDAGNWNVLVLYAVEWTRKQPASPEAWKELGAGYLKMRQFDDALEATRKAAQLSPNDFQLWQDLGQINVALRQPAAALTAFEKATELNARDVTSFVQAGRLNVELGHLPQAGIAFAHALALNPGDADAMCGAASVARKEGRAKDADALARQLKSAGLECRDPEAANAPPPATVAAPAGKKPASPRSR